MLKLVNIKKDYITGDTTVHALKGIDLAFRENEFVAILGHSGCGKTTMLNIIGGLDQYSSGDLVINGRSTKDFADSDRDAYRNHSIGFVFQNYNLLARTTAIENVELPLFYNNSVPAKERRERAEAALQLVGLENRMEHMPNQLSGGQQQRVAIARALVNDPVILLADEATGNLDTRTSYEIMSLFQDLHNQGKTIAFVTHEPDIATFTTRKIKLRDGQIIEDAPINTQSAADALAALNLQKED